MRNLARVIIAALLLAAAWRVWVWMHPSPEKAILRQLAKLSDSLVSKPNEGNFARAAAINRTLSFFTSDVLINTEGLPGSPETIQGKTDLQQALFAARKQLEGEIDFSDIRVKVLPGETNATATFTAIGRLAGQKDPYTQDLKTQFQNIDGNWLISRVDAVTLNAVRPELIPPKRDKTVPLH
jgi:hypothetical protein